MILSTGRSYIFIHIPKTGGTSLALALEQRAMKDDILVGDTPKAQRRNQRNRSLKTAGRLWKHSRLTDLRGLLPDQQMQEMFVFTLIRNPWDRMVSYYYWLRDQSFDHPAVHLAGWLDFEAFVLHPKIQQSFRENPFPSYVRDATGTDLCRAYIRIESFQRDAAPLFDHLGFRLDLPHENRSARGAEYANYYSVQAKKAVFDACREDIERFEYRFE
ncbi:sulfotransferase family 2 domain-containing protein [Ruegeria arenilitoris]|uniref:sulfotransferase family 2 domain-containing protein n=1 Tax=Ruegeria arenilitoris TaxID=1173585 RepID=UPI00147AD47B|nr:sulfotransferase family 2 domain-containing protein [Ruegeria arenilitoris]